MKVGISLKRKKKQSLLLNLKHLNKDWEQILFFIKMIKMIKIQSFYFFFIFLITI